MSSYVSNRGIRAFFMLLAVAVFPASSHAEAPVSRLVESRVGRYLLTETSQGRALYDGVGDARTRGSLADNRPTSSGAGHGCTSWVCTAPVGAGGEPLLEVAGSLPGWNVHTNPGWWSNFLVTSSPVEKVPVAVFWTEDSLRTALTKVRPGREFIRWEFSPH